MRNHTLFIFSICALLASVTLPALSQTNTVTFDFLGFKLGMAKKELGAMSPTMRPWKPVPMMDTRKDVWSLSPKGLASKTLPAFPELTGLYNEKPVIAEIELAWTNNSLCKITVSGPIMSSSAHARDWASAAQELLTPVFGKPKVECEALADRTGSELLDILRRSQAAYIIWAHANVYVFRWADNTVAEELSGRIVPSFQVSSYKLQND